MKKLLPLIVATLWLCACSSPRTLQLAHTLQFPLGTANKACTGVENLIRSHRSVTVTRTMPASGEGCLLTIAWEGALVDVGEVKKKLAAGQRIESISLIFDPMVLTDEVGEALAEKLLGTYSLKLSLGTATLLRLSNEERITTPRRVKLLPTQQKLLQEHLNEYKAPMAKALLTLALDESQRKALAQAARTPLIELRFRLDVKKAGQ